MIAHDHLLLVKTGIDVPQKYEFCSCLASFSLWAWQFCIWTTQHFRSCSLYVKVRQGKSWMVTQGCDSPRSLGGSNRFRRPSWFSKHFRMEWLVTLTGACAAIYLISLQAQYSRSYSGKTMIFYIHIIWWGWVNTYENTIFRGLFTSILTQLFWCEQKRGTIGFDIFSTVVFHTFPEGSSAAAVNSRASVQSFGRGAFLASRRHRVFFGTKPVKKTWFNHQNHQMGLSGAVVFYFCFLNIEPYFCWVKQLDTELITLLTSTI